MNMPGMTMPMPAKPAAKKKTVARKPAPAKVVPAPSSPAAPTTPDAPSNMKRMSMGTATPAGKEMAMPASEQGSGEMAMSGALGPYPMTRESSGTAWQPDASEHMGLMTMSSGWTLMAHGVVNLAYDHQSGPRGDDKAFPSGML
ncbi:MAG: hypothetical protein QOD54_436, partial [Sphingomonadales bacterium]|nr:hypothetical protein [Sphingomonadales bacterium]